MATIYTHQGENIRKTWFLMAGFLVMVIAVGYGVAWYLGNPIILYVAIAFALLMNVGSYWFSDTLVIKMTGAKPLDMHNPQYREVQRIAENLAITAGIPMPKMYVVHDPSPNAFATGRDPQHAAVAVTSGILDLLDRNELEGVLAHEFSHVGNRDMLVATVAVVLAGFVAIVADMLMRAALFGGGNNDNRNPVVLIIGIVGIILAPIAAQLIHLAISRKREYLADASGVLLTRYPEGLASALEKISGHARPMERASHATAHLFISDPFAEGNKRSIGQKVSGLFQTHPPAHDRIRRLREM
ncbi:zinc metalloprotease HtpX [Candidatus Kaiserbacteria bacterium RIFCSPHIGHO2_02_FULL_49_34]|uniref:Protease HtpX homolog n=1 Tax=Candidatus Kaiserbacteria bacterium RIFCSPHIGHO2_02_FULL_49_34 TaxID=1798491 RepID=A0A1F6DIJ1_9BACT|nr:MAG: zinc metalloprotease HtpX [Candidatus Kaiserbacteria bacterium RIFCSPHIGHO2_02_FULL_49_34]